MVFKMKKIKNIAIIIDFVATMIGVAISRSNPDLSNALMVYVGGTALVVAFVCVTIELLKGSKK